jgi:hypothetical protein
MDLPTLEIPRSENSDALKHHEMTADEFTVFAAFEKAVEPLAFGSYPSEYHRVVEEAGKQFGLTPQQSVAFFIRTTLLTFEPDLATDPGLVKTVELAGFFAAQGILSVSGQAGPLIPMLATEKADGQRQMIPVVAEKPEDAVEHGKEALKANSDGASHAVLVWDGHLKLFEGETDALLMSMKMYGPATQSLTMIVPYRGAAEPGGFAVQRPQFVSFAGPATPAYSELAAAFFRGVSGHERGAEIWNRHMDASQ